MAAVIAHEVKNQLARIGGAIQIIGTHMPAEPGTIVANTIVSPMRALAIVVAMSVWLIAPSEAEEITPPRPVGAVIRLQLMQGGRERLGTAVLVDRQPRFDGVTLYFLTSSRLVPWNSTIQTVSTLRRQSEIGVLRVVAGESDAVPLSMRFDAPKPGEAFTIAGFDGAQRPATISQRVSIVSPELVVGDRVSGLVGCVGAPAIFDGSIFGIVTDCESDRTPTIEPLSAARRFLTLKIPSLGGFLLPESCDAPEGLRDVCLP